MYFEVFQNIFQITEEHFVIVVGPWRPSKRHGEDCVNAVVGTGTEQTFDCELIVALDEGFGGFYLFLGERHDWGNGVEVR